MSMEYRELLLEIGCEEMPASWIPGIEKQLAERLSARLDEVRIESRTPVRTFVAPRRLVATVAELAERQSDLEETVTGPPVRAGFDANGEPTRAAIGFARKQGVDVGALARVETSKGEYLACHRRQEGDATRSVLGGLLAATLRDLAFPKAMRWDATLADGRGEFLFGRPIRWLVFLYGARVVPFEIGRTQGAEASGVAPVRAGSVTYGHRFFGGDGTPGRPIEVTSFADYRKRLADACVLIDREERTDRVTRELEESAASAGGRLASLGQESALHEEVPDLVEHPAVVTGTFPEEFLTLPDEVLSTTMVHHQHYFPVVDQQGRLSAHFLAVTNTPGDDPARNERIAGNSERVLVARLRDARFFWDADRAQRLDDRLDRLDTLLFHKRLGSYRAKSERVAELAERIAGEVLGQSVEVAGAARRAAELCKADLATDMVGEFPELQGVMGGVYAREQGEPDAVWKAIYHHYLPVGVGADDPPSRDALGKASTTWAAVALADKVDTVAGLFGAGEKPTGSRDPLGIRRQAQGMLRILIDLPELSGLDIRVSVGELLVPARKMHTKDEWSRVYWSLDRGWKVGRSDKGIAEDTGLGRERVKELLEEHRSEVRQFTAKAGWLGYALKSRPVDFLLERLRYILEERGFDRRNVRAVTHQPLDEIRPLDASRKLQVLPEFTDTADFQTLATLFKRVKNIARELTDGGSSDESFESALTEPAERALLDELQSRRSVIDAAVKTGAGFREAFAEAARIGPAVDRFFNDVFVMADNLTLRRARLRLMREVEQVILQLADVSEIVPER